MVKFKFKIVLSIALTAIFTALVIILVRFLSIQNIAAIPFIRVSLGPTFIIIAGLILGPIYGGIVGFLADLLGFFMFDASGFGYNPLISVTYLLYGLLAGLLVYIIRKNKKMKFPLIQLILFVGMLIFMTYFFSTHDYIILYKVTYELTDALKVGFIAGGLLFSMIYFFLYFAFIGTVKTEEDKVLLNNISAVLSLILISTQLFIGTAIKSAMFEVNFLFLFASQTIATLIEILLGSYIAFIVYLALKKYLKRYIEYK